MTTHQNWIDEILEALWVSIEDNQHSIQNVSMICKQDAQEEIDIETTLSEMQKIKLVELIGEEVHFLPAGEKRAKRIIRRHRLAERLLTDALAVSETSIETTACQFEHILNPEVTDSVCAFLGHPPLCPHGKPIPPGDCCKTYRWDKVKPLVIPLSEMELGKEGKIAFIAPSFYKRLDRLTAMGIMAGNPIIVRQRKPAYVIKIGEMELAISKDIAREIYVRTP